MSKRSTLSSVANLLDVFGSAIAAAAAVEGGRRPQAGHLVRLGIQPKQFYRIGRR